MSMTPHPPESNDQSALSALYWRDEILQVMYWLRGEGISDSVSAEELAPFLTAEADMLRAHLERMADEGFVTPSHNGNVIRYSLTERGRKDGSKLFQEEFAGLTNQAHGECNNPNCACHTLGPEACESRQHTHEHAH